MSKSYPSFVWLKILNYMKTYERCSNLSQISKNAMAAWINSPQYYWLFKEKVYLSFQLRLNLDSDVISFRVSDNFSGVLKHIKDHKEALMREIPMVCGTVFGEGEIIHLLVTRFDIFRKRNLKPKNCRMGNNNFMGNLVFLVKHI